MDAAGLVSLFRKDMVDEASPPLWSDEEVYGYLDDAQKMFCQLAGGIADRSSIITKISVNVNQDSFTYDPRILTITDAFRVSDGREVSVTNYVDMKTRGQRFDRSTGPVEDIVVGMDDNKAYFRPIPSVAETVQLIVERLPLCDIEAGNEAQKLEILPKHHRCLLLRMKELAYSKQDAETLDKTRAKDFGDQFIAYCAQAKSEKERRKHKPRAVVYGGLPIGPRYRRDY